MNNYIGIKGGALGNPGYIHFIESNNSEVMDIIISSSDVLNRENTSSSTTTLDPQIVFNEVKKYLTLNNIEYIFISEENKLIW